MENLGKLKGRGVFEFFHAYSGISGGLSALALLFYLPAFFFSCNTIDGDDTEVPQETVTLHTKADGNFDNIDIFIFNDDALRRLDSYQRAGPSEAASGGTWTSGEDLSGAGGTLSSGGNLSGAGATVTAASRRGRKIIAAVANSARRTEEWSGINSLDALMQATASLEQENPDRPVMCGTARVNMGVDTECSVELVPLMSQVCLRSIRCNFSGKPYAGQSLENVRVYLTNVNGRAPIFKDEGFSPEQIVNSGRLSEGDLAVFSHPEMIVRRLSEGVGSSTLNAGIELYCYPNDCSEETVGSPFTRLVIEGEIDGQQYWYPLNINRPLGGGLGGIARNSRYVYDITITRPGTDGPDVPIDPGMVEIHCSIVPWNEPIEDEVVF